MKCNVCIEMLKSRVARCLKLFACSRLAWEKCAVC